MYKRGLAAKSWNSTPSSTLATEAAAVIFPRPLPQRQTIKLIGKVFYDLSGGAVWGPHMVGSIVVVFGLTHLFGRGYVHTYFLVNMGVWKGAANGYSSSFRKTEPKFRKIIRIRGARLLCGIFIPYAMFRIQFGYCSSACLDSFCQNWGHCTPGTTKDWISWWP